MECHVFRDGADGIGVFARSTAYLTALCWSGEKELCRTEGAKGLVVLFCGGVDAQGK
jgi:hypothetical protein